MKMRVFRRIMLCGLCLGLLVTVSGCQSSLKSSFPSPEFTEAHDFTDKIYYHPEIRFVNAELLPDVFDGEYQMSITVEISNPTDQDIHYGHGYALEYFYDGVWYELYSPLWAQGGGVVLEPGRTNTETYEVPLYVLGGTGKYRLYISDIGYCEIPKDEYVPE